MEDAVNLTTAIVLLIGLMNVTPHVHARCAVDEVREALALQER